MMIKELKDVLVLVEQLPPDWQMECVRRLSWKVRRWEERIQHHLSDPEYTALSNRRHKQLSEHRRRKNRGW